MTDRAGLTSSVQIGVFIAESVPTAYFTSNLTIAPEGVNISFTDQSTYPYDPIDDWSWNFGDGNTSSGRYPIHYYTESGTYIVELTVTDSDHNTSKYSIPIEVTDGGPQASFNLPSNALEGSVIQFLDTSSSWPDPLISWGWNFGDGSTSTIRNPQHTYSSNGTYLVSITVTDSDGSLDTYSATITITDIAPVPDFDVSDYSPLEGESITFTDLTAHYDPIITYRWDMGDGSIFTSRNVTHSYLDSGYYIVVLNVTDSDGAPKEVSKTIVVQPTSPTVEEITTDGDKVTFTMDEPISFQVSAQPVLVPITRFAWDFDYNATEGFVEASGISINQTSWSDHGPGVCSLR